MLLTSMFGLFVSFTSFFVALCLCVSLLFIKWIRHNETQRHMKPPQTLKKPQRTFFLLEFVSLFYLGSMFRWVLLYVVCRCFVEYFFVFNHMSSLIVSLIVSLVSFFRIMVSICRCFCHLFSFLGGWGFWGVGVVSLCHCLFLYVAV